MKSRKTSTSPARRSNEAKTEEDLGIRKVGTKQRQNRSYVFYGKSGTGKTTIAATFPTPILLLDCKDEGEDSIADVEGVDVKEVTCAEDIDDIYWFLKKNPKRYKTVVFDTMSGLQQILVEEVVGDKAGKKNAGDWGTMRKQDWGDIASLMKRWVIDFRDLPVEMVFIAQDRVFNGGDEGDDNEELAPEVGPRVMPSVASALNAAVSVIANTFIRIRFVKKKVDGKEKEIKKVEYCLRVGPNPVYITKIRKPKDVAAPEVIVNATYQDIIDVITGED